MTAENSRIEELLAFDLAVAHGEAPDEPRVTNRRLFEWPKRDTISLVGFDEAGRGALAGPVTVACVLFPNFDRRTFGNLVSTLAGLDDSKRLTAGRRETLESAILACAASGIGWASAREIDAIGIVPSCRRAALRAMNGIERSIDLCLFDRGLSLPDGASFEGRRLPRLEVTHGDARSAHIAAASILAKVARDRMMTQLAKRCPGYDLDRHKGYGTKTHFEAIQRLGPRWVHRRSFLRGKCAQSQSC